MCLFPDEEGTQLIHHDLDKVAEIPAYELVLLCHPITDGSKWAPPRHAKLLLPGTLAAAAITPASGEPFIAVSISALGKKG
jgi:hypothetical protein